MASSRSSSTLDVYTDGSSTTAHDEKEKLLWTQEWDNHQQQRHRRRLRYLWASNMIFVTTTFVLAVLLSTEECRDPSLQVYCTFDSFEYLSYKMKR
jgi:hypothetical protein